MRAPVKLMAAALAALVFLERGDAQVIVSTASELLEAVANAATATVELASDVALGSAVPVTGDIQIASVAGAKHTIRSASGADRLFDVSGSGRLRMASLVLRDGAAPGGGCIHRGASSSASIELVDVDFFNCTATGAAGGGALGVLPPYELFQSGLLAPPAGTFAGNVTVTRCLFSGNHAPLGSGGAFLSYAAEHRVEDTVFANNTAGHVVQNGQLQPPPDAAGFDDELGGKGYGGAVEVSGVNADFARCAFRNNGATLDGGGLVAVLASVRLSGCRFDANFAGRDGGAVHTLLSPLVATDLAVVENRADRFGGGLFVVWGSSSVERAMFVRNVVSASAYDFGHGSFSGDGGAFALYSESGIDGDEDRDAHAFVDVEFVGNRAYDEGGAGFIYGTTATFNRTRWAGNSAETPGTSFGGALFLYQAEATFSATAFENNSAAMYGGAVVMDRSSRAAFVGGTALVGNRADSGGAVCAVSSAVVFDGASLENNTATPVVEGSSTDGVGGAVFLYGAGSRASFSSTRVRGNTAGGTFSSAGGAVSAWPGSDVSARDSVFAANAVTDQGGGGGAVSFAGGVFAAFDTAFVGNSAALGSGGAVCLWSSSGAEFRGDRVSFANNTAGANGGALAADLGAAAVFADACFWGNVAGGAGGALFAAGRPEGPLNCTGGLLSDCGGYAGCALAEDGADGYCDDGASSPLDLRCYADCDSGACDCGAEWGGGAQGVVHYQDSTLLHTENGHFASNSAGTGGGAVAARDHAIVASRGDTYAGNSAPFGGGAALSAGATAGFSSARFAGNLALGGNGGAIAVVAEWEEGEEGEEGEERRLERWLGEGEEDRHRRRLTTPSGLPSSAGVRLSFEGGALEGNGAFGAGGAVAFEDATGDVALDSTAVAYNSARIGGGVSLARARKAVFRSTAFSENEATTGGGGGALLGASGRFRDCAFSHNVAATAGGGIQALGGADVVLQNPFFDSNTLADGTPDNVDAAVPFTVACSNYSAADPGFGAAEFLPCAAPAPPPTTSAPTAVPAPTLAPTSGAFAAPSPGPTAAPDEAEDGDRRYNSAADEREKLQAETERAQITLLLFVVIGLVAAMAACAVALLASNQARKARQRAFRRLRQEQELELATMAPRGLNAADFGHPSQGARIETWPKGMQRPSGGARVAQSQWLGEPPQVEEMLDAPGAWVGGGGRGGGGVRQASPQGSRPLGDGGLQGQRELQLQRALPVSPPPKSMAF